MPITDLATNVILDNVGKVYFLKTGVYRDQVGLDNNHPLSSVSALLIHIEDGVPQNVMVANYAPSKMATWASHDFPLWYRGQVEYTIAGESAPRTFAQYFTYVPSILVAMNKNGTTIMNVDVTITQNTGANLLGGFADLTALNAEYTPTEELSDDLATAYVYESGTKGFYRVAWNSGTSAWQWTLVTQALVTYGVQTKQYNVLPIKVQRGYAPNQTPLTVSDEVIRLIYQEIAYVNAVIANHTELIDDLELEVINNFQALKSLLGIATENDWNYEGEFPVNVMPEGEEADGVNIPNSRNGWCQVGSDLYIFGGTTWLPSDTFDNTYNNRAYKYNVITRTWTRLEDLPIGVNELRCAEKDGVIYLFGMNVSDPANLDKTYKYDIATDTYTLIANPPVRIRISSGAILIDDDIYVMVDAYFAEGATPTTTFINTTPYIYNITSNTWTGTGAVANTRFDRGFSALYEGKIYVQRSLKFQSYDPVADTWDTTLTPPTYGVVQTGLMHITHGRMFIGSGWESALSKNTSYIQYYNFDRDTWQIATRLERDNEAIGYGTLVLFNNKFFYVGGYSDETLTIQNTYVRSFNLEKLQLDRVDALYKQVYDLEDRMDTAESDIDDLETFQNVTVPATYETIANADIIRGRTTALENANMVKSIAVVGTNLFTITFYDDTTSNILTLAQLKTFIGEATNALSGLMTAQHVTDLEMLMALFDGDGDAVVNTIAEVLAIFESYPEGVDLVTALAGKVDKVTGKSLVKDTEIAKLEDLDTQAQTDAKLLTKSNIGHTHDERYYTESEIDTKFRTIDGEIDDIEARTTVIESKLNIVGLDYKEYGVREIVGQSASEFERVTRFGGEIKLGSATGLVANVAIDDADATNSFDYIPIFKREVVNIDATDLSSNVVSNSFVKVPKYYIKEEWTTENGTNYHYIFMSQFKHEGYRLPLPFKKPDGSERDYTYIGAYEAYLDGNNKLRSLTGQIPKVSYSRNNFRIAARALDGLGINSKYQITDLAEYVDLVQIPFMIEFATKHSQGVFAGATSMAYSTSHTAIADGTAVNFIVVSNATGAAFVLGQTVSIGTSNSNDSIAKDRIVTQIDVDTPNAGETTITFDGAAVNIIIGHVIASRAWKTGMTDSVKVSGTHALNDGKHSIVWRGLENPFGNIWKNVDGVKISNWRGYVAENPKDYNDTASVGGVYAEPYLPLGYLNANANNYIQELGYDQNYPYAKFPISVQASSGLYFRDYYYQNTGDRTVFVGGGWNDSSNAGLFSWYLFSALGHTNFNIGARLSYRP